MSNSYDKYLELEAEGAFKFDPTNSSHVLKLAYSKGLRQQVMFGAMDILRDNTEMSNEEVVIASAKNLKLI